MVGLGVGKTHGTFVGGHVNNIINLSKALAEEGFQIHIVTTPPIHSDSEELEPRYELQKNVTIHTVNVQHRVDSKEISKRGNLSLSYGVKAYFKIVSMIRRLCRVEGLDIVHGHSGYPEVALILKYLKIRDRISTIHTLYCPIKENKLYRLFSKLCLSNLDLIIALSGNVKRSLEGIIPESKIKIIPPLIDLPRFIQVSKERTKRMKVHRTHTPHILYIGNLSKTKGLHVLLRALKIVKDNFPNVKLLLGLDIPLERFKCENFEMKKDINVLGLADNVVPLGIIKNLPEIMARSELFVAPFLSTQGPADYPLSILEAMASGLPVVATDVGGIPEIVKHGYNGILVKPNDPLELAEAINYLLENEDEARRMGMRGVEFEKSISEGVVKEYKLMYERMRDKNESTTSNRGDIS